VIENLSFNVAQLLKEPIGATRSGQVVTDLFRLVPEMERYLGAVETALVGPVRLMHSQGGVLVQGNLHTEVTLSCSRCLQPVLVPLGVEIEEVFTSTTDVLTGKPLPVEEEDRALWVDERHILDLSEVLRQAVLLELPMHVLCSDECRGLCPSCGQNLNEGTCDCAPEPDPRWSVLLNLLKE
jgi:uncharacterized protein